MDGVRSERVGLPTRNPAPQPTQFPGAGSPQERVRGTMDRVAASAVLRPQRLGSEERQVIGRSEPVDPHPAPVEESLAPAREQLPLPRRRQQAHLEPQLREPGGPGVGTPFSAFSTPDSEPTGFRRRS